MIKELGHKPKASRPIGKILVIAFGILFTFIFILHVFNLTDLVFKAPKAVVNLFTEGGLKSDNGRVNILLLGVGGEGHEGPYLSDSIILASIDKKGKDVALINIPRDLWVPDISQKINAAYAFGEAKDKQGLAVAKKTVSGLFGVPIHYSLRLDFAGFEKAINLVGGLDINVDNSFTDHTYPIAGKENETCGIQIENKNGDVYFLDSTGSAVFLTEENNPFFCRYEILTFNKGPLHLDGQTALKFVRSRHGDNGENSDFARSARQEKILTAFKQKIFSTETLLNPKKIVDLASTFNNSIDTDIKTEEIPLFIKLAQKAKDATINRIVLDIGRETSVLEEGNPQEHAGQYVLVPKNSGWQELAEFVQGEIFKNTEHPISPTPKTSK